MMEFKERYSIIIRHMIAVYNLLCTKQTTQTHRNVVVKMGATVFYVNVIHV